MRIICLGFLLGAFCAAGQLTDSPTATNAPSKLRSAEDGWLDISGFLDEKFGFLPMAMPITEPAVGYGVAGGLAFISKPLAGAEAGYGRPNITMVGGLGTQNGSWGALAADVRYWLDDRLQTVAGVVYSSINLDYYGIGSNPLLANSPLRYNLEPVGGMLQSKYRLGDSRVWAGLSYAYATTQVTFDAPAGTTGLPDYRKESNVGGVTPSLTYDTRDNIFTPIRGTYAEASVGLFGEALGSDTEFQRAQIIAMQFVPLLPRLFLGLRGMAAASFGNEPFYLRPYISLRGAPIMRYQGEEMAQLEGELRWQLWKRFSLVGFVGGGTVWNDFERLESTRSVVTGGTGFRYELARKYGIHVGLDVAFGPDNTAFYIQIGSAWARP
jgi:outer membrane protein assembly factor BamA